MPLHNWLSPSNGPFVHKSLDASSEMQLSNPQLSFSKLGLCSQLVEFIWGALISFPSSPPIFIGAHICSLQLGAQSTLQLGVQSTASALTQGTFPIPSIWTIVSLVTGNRFKISISVVMKPVTVSYYRINKCINKQDD